VCLDGQCADNLCGGVNCSAAQVCVDDACVDPACNSEACPDGQTCIENACAESPCNGVVCPANQQCAVVVGTAQCVSDWASVPVPDGGPSDAFIEEDVGIEDASAAPEDGGSGDASVGPDLGEDPVDAGSGGEGSGDGGGCTCNSAGKADVGLLFPLLLLPAMRLRRRSRR
jgi:hypothetical protein